MFSILLECLEHLATMIEDYGTSICQPSVAAACKEIAKSIGDRDNSVRTAALNCFVAAFFLHGEALFKFVGNVRIYFIVLIITKYYDNCQMISIKCVYSKSNKSMILQK